MVPEQVSALYTGSVPVWARSITGTGIPTLCPYWYWHFCTLVQYQYGHSPLPVMAFHCACTGIGKYVLGISTSMGTFHYRNWNSIAPVPVLAFFALWFSTSTGRFHKWYWQSMMTIPLLAFMHFGPVPVLAWFITGTGIKWCPYRAYLHFCPIPVWVW